jgi:hypothetical protein
VTLETPAFLHSTERVASSNKCGGSLKKTEPGELPSVGEWECLSSTLKVNLADRARILVSEHKTGFKTGGGKPPLEGVFRRSFGHRIIYIRRLPGASKKGVTTPNDQLTILKGVPPRNLPPVPFPSA